MDANIEYKADIIFSLDDFSHYKKRISRYPNISDGMDSIGHYVAIDNMYDISDYNCSPVFKTLSLTNPKSAFYYNGNGLRIPSSIFMPGCYGYHKQTNALKWKIESPVFKDISHKKACDNIIL